MFASAYLFYLQRYSQHTFSSYTATMAEDVLYLQLPLGQVPLKEELRGINTSTEASVPYSTPPPAKIPLPKEREPPDLKNKIFSQYDVLSTDPFHSYITFDIYTYLSVLQENFSFYFLASGQCFVSVYLIAMSRMLCLLFRYHFLP